MEIIIVVADLNFSQDKRKSGAIKCAQADIVTIY